MIVESHCKTGVPYAFILAVYTLRLLIVPGDSGIRRSISRLVLLFIRRCAFTYSLPYPDRSQRMAIAIFSAGLQLSGADVPVRHDFVVPVLRKSDPMTLSRSSVIRKKWPLLALVIAAIAALILVIWQLQTSPETNDAYVYADTIDVVPEVSGRIVEMPIRDNQRVKKGDLLFRIDPRPYQAMLDDAKARLTTLDAQIMLTQRTIKAQEYNAQSVSAAVERAKALVKQTTSSRIRLEPLVPQGFASQEDLDQARTAEKAARAELEATLLQAKQASAAVTGVDAMVAQRAGILAQIALAELHLEFTEVRAPFNGVVVALKTTVGQYASALKPVFTLLDDDHWYVVANFRETDLQNVRTGVPARITVMTNHGRTFEGVVDSVGTGVLPDGGSVIEGLPVIQKSINWVHVSQRFPVKIAVKDPDLNLFRMGASASAVLQPQ